MTISSTVQQLPGADALLVDRVRSGDGDALGALYDQHAPRLLRVAWRMLGERAEAEDVLHDLFVGLPEALRRYDDRDRLDAWLIRCVVRLALMRLRQTRRRGEHVALDDRMSSGQVAPMSPSKCANWRWPSPHCPWGCARCSSCIGSKDSVTRRLPALSGSPRATRGCVS